MLEVSKDNCTGCSACANICPQHCIKMIPDFEGFMYPLINKTHCIQCGACERTCPSLRKSVGKHIIGSYYAYSNDPELRNRSSSGGVFGELAQTVVSMGGIVFGSVLPNGLEAYHCGIKNVEDLPALQGSKYLQSEIRSSYIEAEAFLRAGKIVLFSGTPCQIAGLLSYLNKPYDSLYTIAVACHGVPSGALWRKYCRELSDSYGTFSQVKFRHKVPSWRNYSLLFQTDGENNYRLIARQDPYMRIFLHNLSLRPSCYHCKHKLPNIAADLTLCDFWGVEKLHVDLGEEPGVSLVIVHSHRGQQLLEIVREKLQMGETELSKALIGNPSLTSSPAIPPERTAFFERIETDSLEILAKDLLPKKTLFRKILRKCKAIFIK